MKTLKEIIAHAQKWENPSATCASFIVRYEAMSEADCQKLRDIFNGANKEEVARSIRGREYMNGFHPSLAIHLRAPCYAGISGRTHFSFISLAIQYLTLKKGDREFVARMKKETSKRTHVLFFPKHTRHASMGDETKYSRRVYDLLMKESWINPHLVQGKTFKWHWENAAIVRVGKLTVQQVFAIGMAMRVPMEHTGRVERTFPKLLEAGFPEKIAARLCLHLYYHDEYQAFLPFPGGHAFCQGNSITEANWKAIFKDDWTLPWTQKQEWANVGDNSYTAFDLDEITTYNGGRVYKYEHDRWKALYEIKKYGWSSAETIKIDMLKGLLNG